MMKHAFTMIELIFVIVIIGILSAIAIPKFVATRDDAKIATTANKINNISTEISAYVVSQGKIETDFTRMSNAAKALITSGTATQSGNTFNVGIGDTSDCIQLILSTSTADTNLTLNHGNAGNDNICKGLQSILDPSSYFLALGGKRITE